MVLLLPCRWDDYWWATAPSIPYNVASVVEMPPNRKINSLILDERRPAEQNAWSIRERLMDGNWQISFTYFINKFTFISSARNGSPTTCRTYSWFIGEISQILGKIYLRLVNEGIEASYVLFVRAYFRYFIGVYFQLHSIPRILVNYHEYLRNTPITLRRGDPRG